MTGVPDLIRARQADLDQSDADVARQLGVSPSTVTRWRQGARPKRQTLPALADWLGVPDVELRQRIGAAEAEEDELVNRVAALARELHAVRAQLDALEERIGPPPVSPALGPARSGHGPAGAGRRRRQ